jgi:hypothetical protein
VLGVLFASASFVGEPEARWTILVARLNRYQGIGWALGLGLGFVVIAVGREFATTIVAQRAFFAVCAVSAGIGLLLGVRSLPPDPGPGTEPTPGRRVARFNVRGVSFPFTPARFDVRQLHPRRFVERFTPQLAAYYQGFSQYTKRSSGRKFGKDSLLSTVGCEISPPTVELSRVGSGRRQKRPIRSRRAGLQVKTVCLRVQRLTNGV